MTSGSSRGVPDASSAQARCRNPLRCSRPAQIAWNPSQGTFSGRCLTQSITQASDTGQPESVLVPAGTVHCKSLAARVAASPPALTSNSSCARDVMRATRTMKQTLASDSFRMAAWMWVFPLMMSAHLSSGQVKPLFLPDTCTATHRPSGCLCKGSAFERFSIIFSRAAVAAAKGECMLICKSSGMTISALSLAAALLKSSARVRWADSRLDSQLPSFCLFGTGSGRKP
mmetsp:Transcript_19150/g.48362  ORF Transcript_19150/g.48362 Transcript_19150/m.48362 type:complete len:229 (+) Transcript_19150:155-841(+)